MEQRQNIVAQFELAVQTYPDETAVRTAHAALTYQALNGRANRLAGLLRNVSGHHERLVALLLDHNEEAIIGMLGVLKAGKTFVPIDPLLPLERAARILTDSGACTLISSGQQLSLARKLQQASGKPVNVIDLGAAGTTCQTNHGLKISDEREAYLFYTSGTTGQPKGVMHTHRTVVRFINAYIDELGIRASDKVLLTTSYSHMVAFIDVFSTLFRGATLVMADVKQDFQARRFAGQLGQMGVTILHTVPAFYRYFMKGVTDKAQLAQVRMVILGGEAVLDRDVALYQANFPDDCQFINLYGSSEVILATRNVLTKQSPNDQKLVPVGRPFAVTRIVLLDENNREVPPNETGELYCSAEFLSPACQRDPAGTAGLVTLPGGSPLERFVKTGDLAKQLPDGNIQLVGRKDDLIKVSGNRVHLSEIEVHLNAEAAIEQSAVVAVSNEAEEVCLVAYLKLAGEKLEIETLRESLRKKLPEYMIPAFFIKVEKIPITTSGKADRKNLPAIPYRELVKYREQHEKTKLRKKILKIWQLTFDKEDITVHDSFFWLGGNSLLATEIASEISSTLNVEVEQRAVFDYQTVSEMARYLESRYAARAV